MTRKFENDPIDDLYAEIAVIKKQLNGLQRQDRLTAPIRNIVNLPPGVEGEIVIADATTATAFSDKSLFIFKDGAWWELRSVAPSTEALMMVLGYRTPDDSYQSVYTIDSLTGVITEVFVGDVAAGTGYPDWYRAKWSRDRTKIYSYTYNGDNQEWEIWQSNVNGSGQSILGVVASPAAFYQNKALKETATDGIKFALATHANPSELRIYDIPGGTYTAIFNSSTLASPYTNGYIHVPQWNADGTKLSFFVQSTSGPSTDGLFTINIDGTGFEVLSTVAASIAAWWDSGGTNVLAVADAGGISTVNSDGTSETSIVTATLRGYPTWNADGTKIAYADDADDLVKIVNRDGTGDLTIANSDMPGIGPGAFNKLSWNQDSTKIARIGYSTSGSIPLKVLDVATLDLLNSFTLTDAPSYATFLQWFTNHDQGDF